MPRGIFYFQVAICTVSPVGRSLTSTLISFSLHLSISSSPYVSASGKAVSVYAWVCACVRILLTRFAGCREKVHVASCTVFITQSNPASHHRVGLQECCCDQIWPPLLFLLSRLKTCPSACLSCLHPGWAQAGILFALQFRLWQVNFCLSCCVSVCFFHALSQGQILFFVR